MSEAERTQSPTEAVELGQDRGVKEHMSEFATISIINIIVLVEVDGSDDRRSEVPSCRAIPLSQINGQSEAKHDDLLGYCR